MSNENKETIADIVADIRAQNQGLPEDSYALSPQVCDLLSLADRIEAAEKHSVTNCNRLGNAAKMREALENIAEYAKAAECHTEDAHLLGYLNQISMWAEDAISAPPRNCDVGTPEEQHRRFMKWCGKHGIDGDMDVACAYPDMCCTLCALRWAQMPYEGENEEIKK